MMLLVTVYGRGNYRQRKRCGGKKGVSYLVVDLCLHRCS